MRGPLVSVITGVYNGERFIAEALRSLFAQDYAPFESVVVDDGSTDGTAAIVQSFPGVRYVRQSNMGLAGAKNTGIAVCNGEYVAFLDADDLLPPHKLSAQLRYFLEHPEVGCVLGRQEIMFDGIEPPPWMTRDPVYGDLDGIPLVSAVIKKRVLEDVGGFDTSFRHREDRDLFVRLREAGVEIAVIPEIVLLRRFHGSNMTGSHPGKHPMLRSLKAKLDRSRERDAATKEGPVE
jgi:glycosyltransferase involved in cell wall biosynthesis